MVELTVLFGGTQLNPLFTPYSLIELLHRLRLPAKTYKLQPVAKCEVMGFCLKCATSKSGGGIPFACNCIFLKRATGSPLGCAQVCICPFFGHAEGIMGMFCLPTFACSLSQCCCFTYQVWQGRNGLRG